MRTVCFCFISTKVPLCIYLNLPILTSIEAILNKILCHTEFALPTPLKLNFISSNDTATFTLSVFPGYSYGQKLVVYVSDFGLWL